MIKIEEIWKDIKNFEGVYMVSNLGNVKSLDRNTKKGFIKGKNLSLFKNDNGYVRVSLQVNNKSKSFTVHRLVAEAFIENPLNKPQVNHIDGDKKNNYVNNLEWATRFENMKHAYDNRLLDNVKILKGFKDNHPGEKVDNNKKLMILTLVRNGFSTKDISEVFGVTRAYVSYLNRNVNNQKL